MELCEMNLSNDAKADRVIGPEIERIINERGAREDDEFVIQAFQERKKTFRLKRSRYLIRTASSFSFDFTSAEIQLPIFGKISHTFELVLVKHMHSRRLDERARYLLKSLSGEPFRLNGVYTFEAFIERGDSVEIGFNRIQFLRPHSHLQVVKHETILTPEIISGPLNIMLEGETGTGKTTLAKMIHEHSKRVGPFIHLNLSSFSPSLIESELFGHVKGAFTGAVADKKGAIIEAHKGTLFLDEIDSLSIELQTKLLLFLDSHELRPVGGHRTVKADVRLIFASGTPLRKLVKSGKMRKDFFYRLTSGIVVELESLRKNPEKIKEHCLKFEKEHYCVLSNDLIEFYQECPWPGNLRQLYSHLKKKKILSAGKKLILDQTDYPLKDEVASQSEISADELKTLEKMKMDYCVSVYNRANKNLTRASKLLDISPNTLKAILEKSRSDKVVDIDF